MYSRYEALVLFMVHRLNRLKRGGAPLLIDRVLFVRVLLYTELNAVYCHFIYYHDYKGLWFQRCLRVPLLIGRKICLLTS